MAAETYEAIAHREARVRVACSLHGMAMTCLVCVHVCIEGDADRNSAGPVRTVDNGSLPTTPDLPACLPSACPDPCSHVVGSEVAHHCRCCNCLVDPLCVKFFKNRFKIT